ncbi:MAG: GNAT family N-acetyltransferase, partial [Clostridia bacterium]|nr:GNAT family N-acetyltransferase [Clostridia bacterium]
MNGVTIRETPLTEAVLETLIAFSRDWEAENSCHGYRANERADIEGMRIFLAEENGRVIGYLFGRPFRSEKASSIMPDGTPYFEIEELYVVPERRSRGVGRALMAAAEQAVKGEAEYIMLSTASKNWRAVLHFYIDEAGMEFWSAR